MGRIFTERVQIDEFTESGTDRNRAGDGLEDSFDRSERGGSQAAVSRLFDVEDVAFASKCLSGFDFVADTHEQFHRAFHQGRGFRSVHYRHHVI